MNYIIDELKKIKAKVSSLIDFLEEEDTLPKEEKKDDDHEFYQEVMNRWNEILNLNKAPVFTVCSKIKRRLANFSKEQIIAAVTRRAEHVKSSSWHNMKINKKHRNDITHVIGSDVSMQRYLDWEAPEVEVLRPMRKAVEKSSLLE